MERMPALNFEKYWHKEIEALRQAYKTDMASHPEAKKSMKKAYEMLTDTARVAGCMPTEFGESKEGESTVKKAEAGRINLCGMLEWETIFSALYGVYMLAFTALKNVLKNSTEKNKTGNAASTPKHVEGLKDQKRKRRSSTEGTGRSHPRNRVQASSRKQRQQQHHKLELHPQSQGTPLCP
jgi:hypothetical protein